MVANNSSNLGPDACRFEMIAASCVWLGLLTTITLVVFVKSMMTHWKSEFETWILSTVWPRLWPHRSLNAFTTFDTFSKRCSSCISFRWFWQTTRKVCFSKITISSLSHILQSCSKACSMGSNRGMSDRTIPQHTNNASLEEKSLDLRKVSGKF